MRKEQTADRLLAALLRQLAEGRDHLHDAITTLDEECKRRKRPNTEQLRKAHFSLVKSHGNIFIVVDGLDECSDWAHDIRPRFLGTLRDLQKIATVKLFTTSRDIPIIQEDFDNHARLEISARKDDVFKYLQGRQDLTRVMLMNEALQLQISQDISEAADGMFLLAQLYFDALKSKKTVADVKNALRGFIQGPRDLRALNAAYQAAIQRIDSQEEEDDREWAHEVLRWVANAGRALSLNELNTALAIRPGDCRLNEENLTPDCCAEVISLCAGLVSINSGSNTVQLVHLTAKEYLDIDSPGWMACAPMKMSLACLTYLTFDDFACARPNSDQAFEERIDHHEFLQYASSYWGHHARHSQPALLQDCNAALWKFLQSRYFTATASQAGNAVGYWNGYSQEPAHWLWSHTLAFFGLGEILNCILTTHMGPHFRDVDVDFEDESCIMTPLALACSQGHVIVVDALLDLGLENVRLDSGLPFGYPTPLGHAVNNGHRAVVERFIALGPSVVDFNTSTHCRRRPLLTVAAKNGFHDLVDSMVCLGPGGIDVDTTRDINRRSPLSYAAQNGHLRTAEYLINLGPSMVKPDRKDKFGDTPLTLAAAGGRADVVKLLMNLGPEQVNSNRTNRSGRTALQEAVIKDRLSVVTTLLAFPQDRVDVNISTETFTQTALGCAAEKGFEAIVGAFISLGEGRVDFNARGWRGMTPLLWAAREGHVGIVKLLTDLKPELVNANLVDVNGYTAAIWAVVNEHYQTAKLLVGLGEERVDTSISDTRDFKVSDYASRRRREFTDLFS
ncbi:ankyrin repeat domain-containing protein 50 [Diplodia corticola]|uniref:Ankyrin repeat domain-containing protein 50 n=1 Tax=Diplodia corticola TaxID=236234 RepID=A0A1J9RWV3_9PEZI|nr:ankyrin repeat domain-containing protein 50 [Diplodia corticola]OJD32324.1 ankyrin repeat domain-containing protein 50 [Diplodia corticola]